MPTVVYRYGLQPPHENEPLVREQFSVAHRIRNRLTEIARAERGATRRVIEGDPAVRAATEAAQVAADRRARAFAAMSAEHSEARSKTHTAETKAELDAARAETKATLIALDAARLAAMKSPAHHRALRAIAKRAAWVRVAWAGCAQATREGLYWGTYQLAADAVQRSLRLVLSPGKSIPLPLWDGLEPRDPRFARWRETNHGVSAQVMGGASPEATDDSRWRIESMPRTVTWQPDRASKHPGAGGKIRTSGPPAPDPNSKRSQRGSHALALRIGSTGRSPVWARWRLILDRPMPAGASIQRVTVKCQRIGEREQWFAMFTVRAPALVPVPASIGGAVSVHVGWRVIGDTLRVARWVDDHGTRGELCLSQEQLRGLGMPSALRSICDERFNGARAWLAWWMGDRIERKEHVPDWLVEMTRGMDDWHWSGRLAKVVLHWRDNPFDGGEGAYRRLDEWRSWDKSHRRWEAEQRVNSLGMRKDLYRKLAARLAREYDTLVLAKIDLRKLAPRPKVDEESENETARANRQRACVSELRESLVNAFTRDGRAVGDVPAAQITHECHACGTMVAFDAAENLSATCPACGSRWDQDDNAADVALQRWHERSSDTETPGTARIRERKENSGSAWARRKAAKIARRITRKAS